MLVRSRKSNPRTPTHQSSALPTELILLQIHEGSRNSNWSFTRATYLGRLLKLLAKRRFTEKPEVDGALLSPQPPPPQVSQLRRASTVISNDFDLLCLLDPQYTQNYTELFFFFRFIDKLQIKKPPPVAILPLGE